MSKRESFLLTLFGTALSSCLHYFLTTQGQLSAVGTLVSAGYGFICGAYMPMSNFPEGLQKVLSFLPGTYATSLLHNHWIRGALNEMGDAGVPGQVLDAIRDGIDCNIYFSGEAVSQVPEFILLTTEAKWYRNDRMTGKGVPELEAAWKAGDTFAVDFVRVFDWE